MEYHREEDVEGDESPNETEENTGASSEDQEESGPGDSTIKLEAVEAWPENQKNEIKRRSSQRLVDWLRITGRQTNRKNHSLKILFPEKRILPLIVLFAGLLYSAIAATLYFD